MKQEGIKIKKKIISISIISVRAFSYLQKCIDLKEDVFLGCFL